MSLTLLRCYRPDFFSRRFFFQLHRSGGYKKTLLQHTPSTITSVVFLWPPAHAAPRRRKKTFFFYSLAPNVGRSAIREECLMALLNDRVHLRAVVDVVSFFFSFLWRLFYRLEWGVGWPSDDKSERSRIDQKICVDFRRSKRRDSTSKVNTWWITQFGRIRRPATLGHCWAKVPAECGHWLLHRHLRRHRRRLQLRVTKEVANVTRRNITSPTEPTLNSVRPITIHLLPDRPPPA